MDRRENGIVLVFEVSTSPATRRIGWIEGQLGKEPLAGSIARCNLPQLRNVCGTQWRIIIDPVEMWGVPFLYQLQFRGPCRLTLPHLLDQLCKGRPVLGCGLWHFDVVGIIRTRLPCRATSTFDPTLATRPTPSAPTEDGKAGRTPYVPRMSRKSDGLIGAASIEMKTSSWPRAGSGTVLSLITSEGSP